MDKELSKKKLNEFTDNYLSKLADSFSYNVYRIQISNNLTNDEMCDLLDIDEMTLNRYKDINNPTKNIPVDLLYKVYLLSKGVFTTPEVEITDEMCKDVDNIISAHKHELTDSEKLQSIMTMLGCDNIDELFTAAIEANKLMNAVSKENEDDYDGCGDSKCKTYTLDLNNLSLSGLMRLMKSIVN